MPEATLVGYSFLLRSTCINYIWMWMTDAEFWSHLALGKCLISERVDVMTSFLSNRDIQQSPTNQEKKKTLQPWQFYTQTFNSLIVTLIAAIKFILLELATLCLLFRPTENKGIMGTLSNFLLCFVWLIWATENPINFGDMIAYLIPRISTHLYQWWKVNTFTPVLWMKSLWGTLNFQFPSALKSFLIPPS